MSSRPSLFESWCSKLFRSAKRKPLCEYSTASLCSGVSLAMAAAFLDSKLSVRLELVWEEEVTTLVNVNRNHTIHTE